MAKYSVRVPIAGYAVVEVEALDEEGAADLALAAVSFNDIEQWDTFRSITQGNVFRGPLNRIDVELIEESAE